MRIWSNLRSRSISWSETISDWGNRVLLDDAWGIYSLIFCTQYKYHNNNIIIILIKWHDKMIKHQFCHNSYFIIFSSILLRKLFIPSLSIHSSYFFVLILPLTIPVLQNQNVSQFPNYHFLIIISDDHLYYVLNWFNVAFFTTVTLLLICWWFTLFNRAFLLIMPILVIC